MTDDSDGATAVVGSSTAGGRERFPLPSGGTDAVLAALAEAGQEPTFVYERLDADTRSPLRSWIGLTGDPLVLPSEVTSRPFDDLRRTVAGLSGPDDVVFAFLAFEAGSPGDHPADDTPAAVLVRPELYLRLDHDLGHGHVLRPGPVLEDEDELRTLARACARPDVEHTAPPQPAAPLEWSAQTSEASYALMAAGVQDAMPSAGDSHGVVLSVRLRADAPSDDMASFRELTRINPSTCMFLLRSPGFSLWGSTSLAMVHVEDGRLTADTDGATRALPDLAPGESYVWEPTDKERHEYDVVELTLREDLAQVAAPGSLTFTRQAEVRAFFGLQHLFAEAQAVVAPDRDAVDVVEALFPHGAVTGYPRAEALTAIAATETVGRGPFGGAIGVFGPGSADVSCVSRSMWSTPTGSVVQAGAKVVVDSDPVEEYAECLLKTSALRRSARRL